MASSPCGSVIEDYSVLYFGPAIFKVARLLVIAMLCVHLFACIFYRVKKESSPPEEVAAFYSSKYVDENVCERNWSSFVVSLNCW